jgi:hydrogenase maturation protein HypF
MDRLAAGNSPAAPIARRIVVGGQVQGVGFRPFVYRLAARWNLRGSVQNLFGQVLIEAEGEPRAVEAFAAGLLAEAPPLARPVLMAVEWIPVGPRTRFEILASAAGEGADVHVPPDHFCCDDCLRELHDPSDRRHRYPFINCTQCGPRYTLITRLPYDRPNTSMAGFPLCDACRAEYANPLDRRFHAEPVACAACGPQLWYEGDAGRVDGSAGALAASVDALRAGRIVAAKGIGGYHLLCDASNDEAVARLRARKNRLDKPLAVMFPAGDPGSDPLTAAQTHLVLDPAMQEALRSPARPIVLAPRRPDSSLSAGIAPGLGEIGAMLPYSPLHHLLLESFGGPLVATSANISGEPVLTEGAEVAQRLRQVADACLHHDRPIVRPADDSVVCVIAGRGRPLRIGRGMAPLERELPIELRVPTLAVGGHMKNTIALGWGRRLVLSPHIGDLDSPRAMEVFAQVIADLQRLYGVEAQRIACDAHPQYASSRWARAGSLPLGAVPHHHAHASALAGEYPQVGRWLVFAWDGVGLGEDGTLWGGEALLGRAGAWRRVASFRPFRLPGGERAGREPWRSAAALCWELGLDWRDSDDIELVHAAWRKGINAPATSAAGRLFDGAAALLGVADKSSFEGQGPMRLEALAAGQGQAVPLPLQADAQGLLRSDWAPLVRHLLASPRSPAERAMDFHLSLARTLVDQAAVLAQGHDFDAVGLAGGVFQNKLLCELALPMLQAAGYAAYLPERVPCNDAGLAFGQIIHVGSQD